MAMVWPPRPVPYLPRTPTDDEPVVLNSRAVREVPANEYTIRNKIDYGWFSLCAGQCWELQNGRFFRVIHVAMNRADRVILLGNELSYAHGSNPIVEGFTNEVVWHLNQNSRATDADGNSDYLIINSSGHTVHGEGLLIRPGTDLLVRRNIAFTNWPLWRFRPVNFPHGLSTNFNGLPESLGRLFCRWKCTDINAESPKEGRIEALSASEADIPFRIADHDLRAAWRGMTALGGNEHGIYTLGDSFCGGGGVSTGARHAGVQVQWAFDMDETALGVYNRNADARTDVLQQDVFDFIRDARHHGRNGRKVDIVHLSPPCQPYSPVNTTPNPENNARNEAVLLSCGDIIEIARPRIFTVEQTAGLATPKHRDSFYRLLRLFIDNHYSVEWKILKCEEYGIPQHRHRLIIIGACAGEGLPGLPAPVTDPRGHDLPRTPTIREAIEISDDATHHGQRWSAQYPFPKPAYDDNKQANTITCKGGENPHPSGTRGFSLREMACLQTFPQHFIFPDSIGLVTGLRKVVGNAVPPKLAEILIKHIIQHLRYKDIQAARTNFDGIPLLVWGLLEHEVIEIDE